MMKESQGYKDLTKKAHIRTFGCQMNQYDSEVIRGLLNREGYIFVDSPEEADLVLVNTCSVRTSAEKRALNTLRHLVGLKTKRGNLKIGVCGCMAERLNSHLFIEGVDFILGPGNIKDLPSILRSLNEGKTRIIATKGIREPKDEGRPLGLGLSSFLPISFGCNRFCSYCIVPFVRGRQRSRDMDEILDEARRLIRDGCKEITLLGQQVNAYGEDLGEGIDLPTLLRGLDSMDGRFWIRFITSHPAKMTNRLIEVMASSKRICEQIHLPLQSGSNRILKRMGRGYTMEEYMDVIKTLREAIPNISITTDIIVGFPGEEDSDFEETLNAIDGIGFDGAFVFRYSPRPGTRAFSFGDDVKEVVKLERLERVVDLQGRITEKRNRELVGKVEEVFVFEKNPRGEGFLGRTRTNKVVVFDGSVDMVGEFIKVKIMDGGRWHLKGRRIDGCR